MACIISTESVGQGIFDRVQSTAVNRELLLEGFEIREPCHDLQSHRIDSISDGILYSLQTLHGFMHVSNMTELRNTLSFNLELILLILPF